MIRPTALPKTLAKLVAKDPRISDACVLDGGFDESEYNYGIYLMPGYRWQGYYTTGKHFRTVREAVEFASYAIEEGETG